ncbi:putative CRISPR-associated protein [Prosthecobacter sp.]|jgi:putative CRISPR-associated protein (TIGR02619 family)|uniref:putative CRISPR-associated protein n=1 Tax=Prosthecobacter sp. TaxID=1965333 RepID=UPI003783D383
MNFSRVIITSGISAISERNILGQLLRINPGPIRFVAGKQNPELAEGHAVEDAAAHVRKLAVSESCIQDARARPRDVSAEYSLLTALARKGLLHGKPDVVLLHTDTLNGRLAAEAVKSLMEELLECRCHLREVDSFDTSDPVRLKQGLGAFMHKVVNELRHLDASYACFAPQGGYKIMASLGYVAGSFLQFPTAYLHEDNQTLHIIPPIPVALAPDEMADLGRLAREVRSHPELSSLTAQDRESVFAHPWLFEISEGHVEPNAFAQFLGLETKPILLSSDALKILGEVHNSDAIRKRIQSLPTLVEEFNKKRGAYGGLLDHEREFTNLNKQGNRPIFHIWKAAAGDFYVAWKEREDGALLINRIWGAGHTYTRDAETACSSNSQGLFDDPSTVRWTPIEEIESTLQKSDVDGHAQNAVKNESADSRGPSERGPEFKKLRKEHALLLQKNAELRKSIGRLGQQNEELKLKFRLSQMQADTSEDD